MDNIVVPLPPEVSMRVLLTLLAASTNAVPGAISAVMRRATNDGHPLTHEQAQAAVLFARSWSVAEITRLAAKGEQS